MNGVICCVECTELSEEIVLIRALKDSNIPKFLADDAQLFNAIISDLFPAVTLPEQVCASELSTSKCRTSINGFFLLLLPH